MTAGSTDEGLTNGVPYHYVVSSENSVGEGADSPLVSPRNLTGCRSISPAF